MLSDGTYSITDLTHGTKEQIEFNVFLKNGDQLLWVNDLPSDMRLLNEGEAIEDGDFALNYDAEVTAIIGKKWAGEIYNPLRHFPVCRKGFKMEFIE